MTLHVINNMSSDAAATNGIEVHGGKHPANERVDTAERDGLLVPEQDEYGYRIHEAPMGSKRPISVIIMGCGAATLNFMKQAEDTLTDVSIRCYEKNDDIGGTWYENRYPGCACDIPSVNYQFSWKPKIWTHYYSYAKEIWEYLKDIEREGNYVHRYVKLRHAVEGAHWDDEAGLWRITVRNVDAGDVFEDTAEFYINAGGVLNSWKMPDIEGLETFNGTRMHTAHYEEGYDLQGKRVAVLGAGSSGVQAVAAIQKEAGHLYHWIRSPIWITAGFAGTWAGKDGANFAYTEEQKCLLAENPNKYLEYRKRVEKEINTRFRFILKGTEDARKAREFSYEQMTRKLKGDERLCEKIIPKDFNPGCRRPTPAPGYLEALVSPNVTVFTEKMQRMTPSGFIDNEGNEHDLDVLICATGFDTTFIPRFPVVAHEKDLRREWLPENGGVTSYLAIGVPDFPNYLTYCGPYGPLGHGSFMALIESWTSYIFSLLTKYQMEHPIHSLTPSVQASREFRQHADLFLKRTAWTSPCRSWFKGGAKEGQAAIWCGGRVQYLELMKSVRWEDWDIKRRGNRFGFLGNGFHLRETDGRDTTDYIGTMDPDGEDKEPEWDDSLVEKLAGWAIDM